MVTGIQLQTLFSFITATFVTQALSRALAQKRKNNDASCSETLHSAVFRHSLLVKNNTRKNAKSISL